MNANSTQNTNFHSETHCFLQKQFNKLDALILPDADLLADFLLTDEDVKTFLADAHFHRALAHCLVIFSYLDEYGLSMEAFQVSEPSKAFCSFVLNALQAT